jgi:hypothetical protein
MNISPFDKGNHFDLMLMIWIPIISPLGIMPLQLITGRRITTPMDMSPPIFSAR